MSGSGSTADDPAAAFAAAMAGADGFEPAPLLAVALSGGPDSLCLALLVQAWAAARGGTAVALILDHGVRPASRIEAGLAAAWAAAAGLDVRLLRLPPGMPPRAAALRRARYDALEAAAAEAGALHLLAGHHRSDQAETVVLRALRRSGEAGLAGMAPVRMLGRVRLIRPLLGVTPAAIRAWLAARRQPWILDPSNERSGARAGLRAAMAGCDGAGTAISDLADAASALRRRVAARDEAVAALLGTAASLPADGGVMLDRAALDAAAPEIREAALVRVLAALSGRAHAPRGSRLGRAGAALVAGRAFSLGGCVIRPCGSAWRVTAERRRTARRVATVAASGRVGYADPVTDAAMVEPPSRPPRTEGHWTEGGRHHL